MLQFVLLSYIIFFSSAKENLVFLALPPYRHSLVSNPVSYYPPPSQHDVKNDNYESPRWIFDFVRDLSTQESVLTVQRLDQDGLWGFNRELHEDEMHLLRFAESVCKILREFQNGPTGSLTNDADLFQLEVRLDRRKEQFVGSFLNPYRCTSAAVRGVSNLECFRGFDVCIVKLDAWIKWVKLKALEISIYEAVEVALEEYMSTPSSVARLPFFGLAETRASPTGADDWFHPEGEGRQINLNTAPSVLESVPSLMQLRMQKGGGGMRIMEAVERALASRFFDPYLMKNSDYFNRQDQPLKEVFMRLRAFVLALDFTLKALGNLANPMDLVESKFYLSSITLLSSHEDKEEQGLTRGSLFESCHPSTASGICDSQSEPTGLSDHASTRTEHIPSATSGEVEAVRTLVDAGRDFFRMIVEREHENRASGISNGRICRLPVEVLELGEEIIRLSLEEGEHHPNTRSALLGLKILVGVGVLEGYEISLPLLRNAQGILFPLNQHTSSLQLKYDHYDLTRHREKLLKDSMSADSEVLKLATNSGRSWLRF